MTTLVFHLDARFGLVGAGLNLYRKMGANPAHKLLDYFRERIQNKFGNPDVTFEQVNVMSIPRRTGSCAHIHGIYLLYAEKNTKTSDLRKRNISAKMSQTPLSCQD